MQSLLDAIAKIAATYPTQEGGQIGNGMDSASPTTDQKPSSAQAMAAKNYLRARAERLRNEGSTND